MSNCSICNNKRHLIFSTKILNKYIVDYFKCEVCEFIQTEEPYWLSESYHNAIASMDVGLVNRNLLFSDIGKKIIVQNFNYQNIFLDYAGGYGLFVRLMRDKGFNFYRQDIYCENIFAINFDLQDLQASQKFELVTAFEVFEHLTNPLLEIEKIFNFSESILFSTELKPEISIKSTKDWWYFVPETGQHISLYSLKTLNMIALHFNCNFYTNGTTLHLFTKKKFKNNPFNHLDENNILGKLLTKLVNRLGKKRKNENGLGSLIYQDFELAKNKINQ